ncbi:MAG: hypothetical protein GWP06_01020 [Actinobacteria bacterium]|nr:hypothetical protein [Actinomycetota bacterium]
MKQNSLLQFQEIISSIESQSYEQTKQFEIYKCRVTFLDGSNLRIFEKYDNKKLVYYSYYWLSAFNDLIIGWDRAPHHQDISSYPHHKHVGSQGDVTASAENNLTAV